jgi:hypothetical protein
VKTGNLFWKIYFHFIREWSGKENKVIESRFKPVIKPTTIDDFLIASKQFFDTFQGKHIGVQLSGGLDSSLIISLLNHFKIPFSLIGMTSERYEFRSEKVIQNLYAPAGKNTVLLDYEKHLPFSEMEFVPPHQYPDMFCINYSANKAMAEECKKMGIEILLTGSGGDNIFAEPIPKNLEECTWLPLGFIEGWLDDLIYQPYGVKLTPFYADSELLNALYNLRLGEPEDNSKLWARSFFKDFLPKELINFTYCADFWGLYISGLQNAIPTVYDLFKNAYKLTENPFFSEENTDELFCQDILNAKKEMYQQLESRIAIAVWLNALKIDKE